MRNGCIVKRRDLYDRRHLRFARWRTCKTNRWKYSEKHFVLCAEDVNEEGIATIMGIEIKYE